MLYTLVNSDLNYFGVEFDIDWYYGWNLEMVNYRYTGKFNNINTYKSNPAYSLTIL